MGPSISLTIAVVALYSLGGLTWLPALLHKNQLAIMGTAWLLLSIFATLGIGIFVFGEVLGLRQWTGVILAVIALGLLGV